ncbi:MAG: NAD(P)H-dependent oxidoreductase [Bacteroidia bacterium]|nr:NAD(P)H-dependent oxidoreductase [Bacteroidia bacterium]
MKKVLVFGGSNNSESINQELARIAGKLLERTTMQEIKLSDYPLPIYGIDHEKTLGIPEEATKLKAVFDAYDAYIISVPEHNLSVPAFFKNSIDWLSRIHMSFFEHKPILLLSTSPGKGGGESSLAHAETILSNYLAGRIVGKFSLARFYQSVEIQEDGSIRLKEEYLEVLKEEVDRLEEEVGAKVESL